MALSRTDNPEGISASELRTRVFEKLTASQQGYFPNETFVRSFPVDDQALLIRASDSACLWVKMLTEPLTHAGLDALRDECRRVRHWTEDQRIPNAYFKYFVFFPSMNKGVRESFDLFSSCWNFFEFTILEDNGNSRFDCREYKGKAVSQSSTRAASEKPEKTEFRPDPALKSSRLNRSELNDLLEIILSLKNR